jgi:hypothetical protein
MWVSSAAVCEPFRQPRLGNDKGTGDENQGRDNVIEHGAWELQEQDTSDSATQ